MFFDEDAGSAGVGLEDCEGYYDDAGADGHEDGEHADSPAPADAVYDAFDDECRDPGYDEKREVEDVVGEGSPSHRSQI